MPRTFVALEIDPGKPMLECIREARQVLKDSKIKWVETGNLHITLKFLGDTSEQQVKECSGIIRQTAGRFKRPEAVFGGMGLFRNLRDPRVLWIGMKADRAFFELQKELSGKLEPIGFPPENRKSRPHLTIGRIKYLSRAEELQDLMERYRESRFQRVKFHEIIYFESILKPEGAEYRPILKVPFRKD